MNNDLSIEVKDLVKVYNLYNSSADRLKEIFSIRGKKFHDNYYALNGINFSVKKGETFGIIGTNGAGKSTLLKLITGVARGRLMLMERFLRCWNWVRALIKIIRE